MVQSAAMTPVTGLRTGATPCGWLSPGGEPVGSARCDDQSMGSAPDPALAKPRRARWSSSMSGGQNPADGSLFDHHFDHHLPGSRQSAVVHERPPSPLTSTNVLW